MVNTMCVASSFSSSSLLRSPRVFALRATAPKILGRQRFSLFGLSVFVSPEREAFLRFSSVPSLTNSSTEDIPIYNYVSSVENPLTWGRFTDLNIKNGFDYPFSNAIWYLSFHAHKTAFMNRVYMIFLHLLPALIMDSMSYCVGQPPRLLKAYEKIHKFSNVISFFCTNEWVSRRRTHAAQHCD